MGSMTVCCSEYHVLTVPSKLSPVTQGRRSKHWATTGLAYHIDNKEMVSIGVLPSWMWYEQSTLLFGGEMGRAMAIGWWMHVVLDTCSWPSNNCAQIEVDKASFVQICTYATYALSLLPLLTTRHPPNTQPHWHCPIPLTQASSPPVPELCISSFSQPILSYPAALLALFMYWRHCCVFFISRMKGYWGWPSER